MADRDTTAAPGRLALDAPAMQVICDPANTRFSAFQERLNGFAESLGDDERRVMQLVAAAANLGLAEHGERLVAEADVLGAATAYEDEIEAALGEDYVDPQATGLFCIRLTVRFNCATRLFQC